MKRTPLNCVPDVRACECRLKFALRDHFATTLRERVIYYDYNSFHHSMPLGACFEREPKLAPMLKNGLITAPVLSHLDEDAETAIYSDASNQGLGDVFSYSHYAKARAEGGVGHLTPTLPGPLTDHCFTRRTAGVIAESVKVVW